MRASVARLTGSLLLLGPYCSFPKVLPILEAMKAFQLRGSIQYKESVRSLGSVFLLLPKHNHQESYLRVLLHLCIHQVLMVNDYSERKLVEGGSLT